MLFKLDQIETFVEVARHKSFSLAGEKLRVTQPLISSRVKKLEEILGFKLILRNTKSVSLTNEGDVFLEKCIEIVDNIRSAERLAAEIGEKSSPRVRIGALAMHVWRRWWILESFMSQYPKAHLEIEIGLSNQLAEQLLRGDLDVAFIHRRPSLALESVQLLKARYGMLSPQVEGVGSGPMELSELSGREIGLFRSEMAPDLHDQITQVLDMHSVRTVAIPEVTDEGIVNFVRRMHIPVLSFQPWDDNSAPEDLMFHEISDLVVAVDFVLARASRTSRAADLLWSHCLKCLPNQLP